MMSLCVCEPLGLIVFTCMTMSGAVLFCEDGSHPVIQNSKLAWNLERFTGVTICSVEIKAVEPPCPTRVLLLMLMGVQPTYLYVYVPLAYLVPMAATRGHQVPWD